MADFVTPLDKLHWLRICESNENKIHIECTLKTYERGQTILTIKDTEFYPDNLNSIDFIVQSKQQIDFIVCQVTVGINVEKDKELGEIFKVLLDNEIGVRVINIRETSFGYHLEKNRNVSLSYDMFVQFFVFQLQTLRELHISRQTFAIYQLDDFRRELYDFGRHRSYVMNRLVMFRKISENPGNTYNFTAKQIEEMFNIEVESEIDDLAALLETHLNNTGFNENIKILTHGDKIEMLHVYKHHCFYDFTPYHWEERMFPYVDEHLKLKVDLILPRNDPGYLTFLEFISNSIILKSINIFIPDCSEQILMETTRRLLYNMNITAVYLIVNFWNSRLNDVLSDIVPRRARYPIYFDIALTYQVNSAEFMLFDSEDMKSQVSSDFLFKQLSDRLKNVNGSLISFCGRRVITEPTPVNNNNNIPVRRAG